MRGTSIAFRSLVATLAVVGLGMAVSTGCGDVDTRDLNMVTVNWIEGMAMTYTQEQIVEDSLGVNVEISEVQGGGIAFKSVAGDAADVFNEAWLPTTHQEPWEATKGSLQKLGYTYRGTSVGIAVPTYVEVDTFPELSTYAQELDGTINGIESGAAINKQTHRTLELYDMVGEFSVAAASGPATWQALESAIAEQEPIAVVAWKPHWKWNEFDLKYIDGAHTGHNVDIWGRPEDIFTLVDNQFTDEFPKEVVCFLKEFEADDREVGSMMNAFRTRGDMSKPEAAREWIENHPADVSRWLVQTRSCTASDDVPEPLPDDAAYSSRKGGAAAP